MNIKRLSELSLFVLAFTWTFGILIASLVSMKNLSSIQVPGKDKSIHFLFYFVLTLLWNFALQRKFKNDSLKYIIVVFVFIYGTIIEVLQDKFTKYREADIYDAIANLSGALVALIIIIMLNSKILKKNT